MSRISEKIEEIAIITDEISYDVKNLENIEDFLAEIKQRLHDAGSISNPKYDNDDKKQVIYMLKSLIDMYVK